MSLLNANNSEQKEFHEKFSKLLTNVANNFDKYYNQVLKANVSTGKKTKIDGKEITWSVRQSSRTKSYYQKILEGIKNVPKQEYYHFQDKLGARSNEKGIYIGKTEDSVGVAFYAFEDNQKTLLVRLLQVGKKYRRYCFDRS